MSSVRGKNTRAVRVFLPDKNCSSATNQATAIQCNSFVCVWTQLGYKAEGICCWIFLVVVCILTESGQVCSLGRCNKDTNLRRRFKTPSPNFSSCTFSPLFIITANKTNENSFLDNICSSLICYNRLILANSRNQPPHSLSENF